MQDPSHQPPQPTSPPYVQPAAPGPSRVKLWAAGAAVVSAIAGVASAVAAFSDHTAPPAAVPPPTSATVGAPPPQSPAGIAASPGTGAAAGAGSAAGSGSPGAAASVRWSGTVVLGLEGLDLSQVPPRQKEGTLIRPAAGRNGSSSMEVLGTAALWPDAASEPTAQGCKDLLATQSRKSVVVAEGDSVCLVNENSPIGVLKVTATKYDEGSYGLIEGRLTTWNLRADR
ncbi:hypothetical protein [Streptomyces sp. NPDC029003]|uniref:hypothetical protein n=1 Tax=Streptomyces sp. NPDC029003 TaxID=3155125 RepID=UPI0033ECD92C